MPWTPLSARRCGMIAEGQERRHVVVGHEPHVTAVAPVAAIRAAEGHGTLAAEADTARAAVATASVQLALVDELGHFVQANAERGRPSRIVASVDDLPLDDSADERADRWASTMAGHETHLGVHDVVVAHADSVRRDHARPSERPSDRQAREDRDTSVLATGATRASGAGDRAVRRATRPVPDVLRAGSRSHPARFVVPEARRQDAGVRVPRRSPAHAHDPCPRGHPGGPIDRRSAATQRASRRGDRHRARLRARPGRTRQRGRPLALSRRRVRPCAMGRRRHAAAAQPVPRDPRRDPSPFVEPAGAADTGR